MTDKYTNDMAEIREQINNISCDIRIAMSVSDKRITTRNIVIAVLFALLILSNAAWFAYENQFEEFEETTTTTETYTIKQDSESGNNNHIGRDGNVTYGEPKNNGN